MRSRKRVLLDPVLGNPELIPSAACGPPFMIPCICGVACTHRLSQAVTWRGHSTPVSCCAESAVRCARTHAITRKFAGTAIHRVPGVRLGLWYTTYNPVISLPLDLTTLCCAEHRSSYRHVAMSRCRVLCAVVLGQFWGRGVCCTRCVC